MKSGYDTCATCGKAQPPEWPLKICPACNQKVVDAWQGELAHGKRKGVTR